MLAMMKKVFLAILLSFFILTTGCNNNEPASAPLSEKYEPQSLKPLASPPPPPPIVTNCAVKIYPAEDNGVVRLEKCMPPQVQTGAEFEYKIKVTNLTDCALSDVVIMDKLNENFQYKTANPPASARENKLVWVFPILAPKETKEITGIGIAAARGIVQNCVDVTYKMPLCVQTLSIQPKVAIGKTAPAEVSICDMINYTLTIQNTGNGPADNVKIIDNLPDGLITAHSANKIEVPIGTLSAGTARTIKIVVKAQRTGTYTTKAVAFADGNIRVESPAVTTVVKQPKLSITKIGPDTLDIGEEAAYEIAVTNIGDWPAFNTVIEDKIPAAVTSVKLSQGGAMINNKAMWKVAKLNPGATAKIAVNYTPNTAGTIINTAKASAGCCAPVTAEFRTQVKGVPGILLELIDLTDPIKIGDNATYKIMVTNQGSAVGTNIAVKATLEPQMQYVSSVGATNGTFADGVIAFAPLSSLAPKARASWEVVVKAKALGDVRFKVQMISDQLERNVEETESTNFYE
jgi:uncharacterized repeat protein (TIGR01451 family)